MLSSRSEGRACCTFHFELLPFHFPGAGEGGRILGRSQHSGAACLLCMAADGEGERDELINFELPPFRFTAAGGGR